MNRSRISILILLLSLATWISAHAESCTYNDSQEPVYIYTQAMKEYRFKDAYPVLTDNMTGGLPVDKWVVGQRTMFDLGQVVIGGLDVRWPQHLDAKSCKKRALVPNVLKAKDRFNNQGSTEFELYTAVYDGTTWRIDSQKTLFDEAEIHQWFPGHKIPKYKGQLPNDEALPGDEDF